MCEGYEEDLDMYCEVPDFPPDRLDAQALLRPISDLSYPKRPPRVGPGTSVAEALAAMAEERAGAVLVVEGGKLVGILSERDVLIKRLYEGKDLDRPVRDFMTPDPECLTPYDSIAFALNRMAQGGYRHVPLTNANGDPVGVLPMRDVVGYVASFFPREVLNAPPHSECNPPDRRAEGG